MKASNKFYRSVRLFGAVIIQGAILAALPASGQEPAMGDFTLKPRNSQSGVAPLVMLAVSNDHQLYYKAYTDFDDIWGEDTPDNAANGVLDKEETTYLHDLKNGYAGYFEPTLCYSYSAQPDQEGVFEIIGEATNRYCDSYSNAWSGNFLNWATMTRIDILRKVLFGGARSTDTASRTILERSYLPNDAHSFAKFYNGTDLHKLTPYSYSTGLTICNTTLHDAANNSSVNNTNSPLMRVVEGNFSFWAAAERHQCLISGSNELPSGSPTTTGVAVGDDEETAVENLLKAYGFEPHFRAPNDPSAVFDFSVRVEACKASVAPSLPNCTRYGNNYKPEGVLQRFSINDQIQWGLLTGSYDKNKTAGALRKNTGFISNEIDPDTGVFEGNVTEGLISQLNAMRIAGWRWQSGNNTSYNLDGCRWGQADYAEGNCVDWGNPFGEILAESYRYFANANATIFANGNDEPKAPPGVHVALWQDAVTNENYCAPLNVIGLNASANSFDRDGFISGQAFQGINTNSGGPINIGPRTNQVARDLYTAADEELERLKAQHGEGHPAVKAQEALVNSLNVDDAEYFVGSNGVDNDGQCSAKSLATSGLAGATGSCFGAPRQQGGWHIAGLSDYVDNNDINAVDGDQTIKTHGIELASALPKIEIPVPDSERKILLTPACTNEGIRFDYTGTSNTVQENSNDGNCALVDFRLLDINVTDTSTTGAIYVNWEDSEQGGDYDQDMHGIIKFSVLPEGDAELENNDDDVNVTITTQVIGESTRSRLGFGYVIQSVEESGVYFHSGINGFEGVFVGGACEGLTTTVRYGSAQNQVEVSPGCGIDQGESSLSFKSSNSAAKELKSPLEYAARASCGKFIDNNNSSTLEGDLVQVISSLNRETPFGASETATSGVKGGLFVHTLSYPRKVRNNDPDTCGQNVVTWVGQVGALRVGDNNDLYDAEGNRLDFTESEPGEVAVIAADGTSRDISFDEINYFWNTTETLKAQSARRIYTAVVEAPLDGNMLNTDIIRSTTEFEALTPNESFLLSSQLDSASLVSFIRGSESGINYRSRSLGDTTYLLGDISTSPLIQGVPDYSYFTEFGDQTYDAYVKAKEGQRNIVYVASNNGMIQAINAGKTNANRDGFDDGGPTDDGNIALGEELWAYIPFNLLPHLQWLADKSYSRVPYFDGYMRTFDVKAWQGTSEENSNGHVDGWGTILVVGTGMGGGHYSLDTDEDGEPEIVTKPAYIVLDVSNRNAVEPTLIAEISHDQLGFTTAEPDVIRRATLGEDGDSEWYLVFGSGPRGDDQTARRSAQTSYVMPVTANDSDLKSPYLFSLRLGSSTAALSLTEVSAADEGAFIGAINGMDWDRDFEDDAIYFGTISGSQAEPDGKLMRALVNFNNGLSMAPYVMFDTGKPVVKRPVTVINQRNYWVFAGTGRYYTRGDASEVNSDNIFLGLKERTESDGSVDRDFDFTNTRLFNANAVASVDTGGNIYDASGGSFRADNKDLSKVDLLRKHIRDWTPELSGTAPPPKPYYEGWIRTFGANERQHAQAGYLASTLFVGTTVPGAGDACSASDQGALYILDMRSGVASPFVQDERYTRRIQVAGGREVDAVNLPINLDGAAPDMNDPASLLFNKDDGGVGKLPELNVNIPSQRHSWREVTVPW